MTIVGKILVFVNLVFSLVVAGLVMMVYLTRANWEHEYKRSESELKAARADRDQTKENMETAATRSEAKVAAANKERDAAVKERDTAQQQFAQKDAELTTIKQKDRAAAADVTVFQEGSEARRQQVRELEVSNAKLLEASKVLLKEKMDERRLRIQAQVERGSFASRNAEMEQKMKELQREIERKSSGATGAVVSRKRGEENPPPDNVEGRITSFDPESGLVKLSIGSDAGLTAGHTLKVFRLHPIPEQSRFLGNIEILSVRPHEAVGRSTKPLSFPLKNGDRVASRLLIGG